jgi:molybdate transport system substrate-binding protein
MSTQLSSCDSHREIGDVSNLSMIFSCPQRRFLLRYLLRSLHPLRALPVFIVLCLLLAACGGSNTTTTTSNATPTAAPVTLNVFAAASLTASFKEIATQYQAANPSLKITYNFNGSQLLVQQILNGAKADVFASADLVNMKKASDAGLVGNQQVFAKNRLAVIVPTSNPAGINTLKDLSKKGVKIVVAAPGVPVGKYAIQVLDKLGKSPDYGAAYESSVKANFVSQEENVTAVVNKVQLGEADAGIVYRTDVTAANADKVKLIDIPDQFNVIAQYPIATLKNSAHATQAEAFVQYILSSDGQAVLTKYRFISPTA